MSFHLFALDDDLAALEALPEKAGEAAEVGVLVELCWHLRQRDCARALALAERAEARMAGAQCLPAAMARLQLVRGEIKALFADIEGARTLLQAALAAFLEEGDYVGAGDAEWLLSSAWNERGDREARDRELERALSYYEKAGAESRVQIARARQLAYVAFNDPGTASVGLAQYFDEAVVYDEAVRVWVATARANVAALTDDPGGAIKYDLQAYDAAQATGQIKQALISAVNIAEGFATLGDLTTALDWDERALTLARGTGWPVSIGLCLRQTGETLRLLKRLDEAGPYLYEAYETLSVLSGSRNYAAIVSSLGHLALDTGDYKTALERFLEFEQTDSAQSDVELRSKVYRGKSTALAHLGQFNNALTWVEKSLQLAREKGNIEEQIQALRVYADLHAGHPSVAGKSPALPFLQQALALCEGIEGYAVPAELFSQLAAAYAAAGDYKEAYRNEQASTAARNHTSNVEAQKQALAMQIRYEIDRARADTEHHRALAATLQETNVTLEALGSIGREITGSLDSSDVHGALYRHAGRLLDVHGFAIYLVRGEMLQQAFCMRGSENLGDAAAGIPLQSETSNLACCARDRSEFVVAGQDFADAIMPSAQSALFAPLIAGKRLLGVVTVQSESPQGLRRTRAIDHPHAMRLWRNRARQCRSL
ncbi:MAG TPA: hypothetical protein VF472_04995 [Burkholderiaceae bacterium]